MLKIVLFMFFFYDLNMINFMFCFLFFNEKICLNS